MKWQQENAFMRDTIEQLCAVWTVVCVQNGKTKRDAQWLNASMTYKI